jgi:GDP-L-fucose synthase
MLTSSSQLQLENSVRVLVTGSNGPLGYAIRSLAKEVNVLDFVYSNSREVNLTNKKETHDYVSFLKPDLVLHLAAKSGAAKLNQEIPVTMFEDNMTMAMNVLSASVESKVKRVLLISSVAAYPSQRIGPANEASLHQGPPSQSDFPYAIAKRMMHPLVLAYRSQFDLDASVLVVNGIVGPKMNFKNGESVMLAGLIRRFYEQSISSKRDENYLVFGDGTPIREYTSSFDLAKAMFWLAQQQTIPEILNIGNSDGRTIAEYANIVASALKLDPYRITFSETATANGIKYNQQTDNSAFVGISNFEYSSTEDSIEATVKWVKENYGEILKCD